MEASVVERERALQSSSAAPEHVAAERRRSGRLIPPLFLGSVLGMYLVIGCAIYALIAVLT
jgi:hypothetical protein